MFELRSPIYSDFSGIAALHTVSWRNTYRGILSDRFLDDEVENYLLNMWENRIKTPASNQLITIAVSANTIIGFSCIYLDDSASYGTLLDNLHVHSRFLQTGVGKSLVRNSAKLILEKCVNPNMYLWVYEGNHKAMQVYQHWGGNKVETIRKQNMDGTEANSCRIIWNNVSVLLS